MRSLFKTQFYFSPKIIKQRQEQKKWFQLWSRQSKGQQLFDEIEQHVFSDQFEIESKQLLVKFNILVIHTWLLQNRLRQLNSIRVRRDLDHILQIYTKDYVFQFEDHYDQLVKQELERNQRIIYFMLDDYFIYQFHSKPLSQILIEDVLLNTRDDAQQLQTYVDAKMKLLSSLSYKEIVDDKIEW